MEGTLQGISRKRKGGNEGGLTARPRRRARPMPGVKKTPPPASGPFWKKSPSEVQSEKKAGQRETRSEQGNCSPRGVEWEL